MTIAIDESGQVREGEALDTTRLAPYLREHFGDADGPLHVEQFLRGHSNLTYRVRLGNRDLVLRRPPVGNQVKTAHDMGREYRVLSRLWKVYPAAPRALLYCADESILGAPFYVMERRRGIILRGEPAAAAALDAATVRRLCEQLIDTLARLHAVDYAAAGLAELGRPEGFVERQVRGWTKRYDNAQTAEIPSMNAVAQWLGGNMPVESDATLIHNDFKFDNVMLDADDPTRIVAVLDWEMATLGDPLMDLGTTLGFWVQADDPERTTGLIVGPTNLPGSMTRREVVDRYAEKTGRDTADMLFYYCFGLFKIAVIVQQIYARYARGLTRDPRFAEMNAVVVRTADCAMHAIRNQTF